MEKLFNLLERFVNAVEKIAEAGNAPVAQIPVVTQGPAEQEKQATASTLPEIPEDLSKLTIEALRELAAKLDAAKDFPKGTRVNTIISWIETKRKELKAGVTAPPAEEVKAPVQEAPVVDPDPLNFDPLGGFDALGEDPVDDGVKVYLSKDVTETLRAFVMGAVGVGADHPEFPARFNKIKDEVLMPLLNRHGVSSAQNLPENVANAIMNDEKAGPKLREVHLNCVEAMVR